MRNDTRTRRGAVAACLPAIMIVVGQTVYADELGATVGGESGYQHVALNYQTAPKWQGLFASHPVEVSLEYSLGMVRADSVRSSRELGQAGVTPFARWWLASNTGLELGVGANVFSGTHLGNKEISTAFQFGSSIGLTHRWQGTPWQLGLRLTHYSNVAIKKPNPGQNYVQLRVGYAFR